MTIGICSPISIAFFAGYLHPECRDLALRCSNHDAPAVTTLGLTWLEMGHRVVIFTFDSAVKTATRLEGERLVVYVSPYRKETFWGKVLHKLWIGEPLMVRHLFKMCREELDVVSCHWTRHFPIGAYWALGGKTPITVTVRDIMPELQLIARGRIDRTDKLYVQQHYVMSRKALHFIANSEYTAAMMQKYWGIENCPVMYNTVAPYFLEHMDDPIEREERFTIVSIATVNDRRKNMEKLVQAFHEFVASYPCVQLLLIGTPFADEDAVCQEWRRKGWLQNVTLCGPKGREELQKLLKQAHLLVHPALEETFGNIFVEAMSCGCSVLGGDKSGAVPYLLQQGKLGWLCDVTSVEDICKKMEYIYTHPEETVAKIRAGREAVLTRFSNTVVAQQYVEYFNSIKGTGARKRGGDLSCGLKIYRF